MSNGHNIPFIDDDSISFIPTKAEFVEEKRRQKKTKNKILRSYVEEVVQDFLVKGISYSDIVTKLKEEYQFQVSYATVKDYDTFIFQDLENEAVQRVKEKLLHHLDSDKHTIEALYEKCATHIEFLHQSYDRIRTEIEGYREELTEELEDGTLKLSQNEKMKYIDLIHEREKTLSSIRAQIAEKLEGPSGSIERNLKLIQEISSFYYKLTKELCPIDKWNSTKIKIMDFMRKYDE